MTSITGVKAYVIAAICSASLTGCYYAQPNSHVVLSDQDKTTNMQSATDKHKVAGSYALIRSPEMTDVIIDIAQSGITSPAKQIQVTLSFQQQVVDGRKPEVILLSCQYKATATLMGQDALHGMIYTAPVSSITTINNESSIQNNQGLLFFRFKDNVLSLDSNNPDALPNLCENNIQLIGDYSKLN